MAAGVAIRATSPGFTTLALQGNRKLRRGQFP
jgi:hypothetical protein